MQEIIATLLLGLLEFTIANDVTSKNQTIGCKVLIGHHHKIVYNCCWSLNDGHKVTNIEVSTSSSEQIEEFELHFSLLWANVIH